MEIKLYKSPWRGIKLIFLSSILVFIGWLLLNSNENPRWLIWFYTCFFGLGLLVGVFHLVDRRPQIIINEIGIFDRTAYKDFINWNVIRDAYLINISGQKFICLVVDAQYEPSFKRGRLFKSAAKISKKIGAQLNIALGQIVIDEQKLTAFILAMLTVSPEDRQEKLKNKLLF